MNLNKDNIEDFWSVIQALHEGKTIQAYTQNVGWVDCEDISFNCYPHIYRVKPKESRKIYGISSNDGCIIAISIERSYIEREYDFKQYHLQNMKIVEFVEKINL